MDRDPVDCVGHGPNNNVYFFLKYTHDVYFVVILMYTLLTNRT